MSLTRSQNMARIRSKNTSPELAIRKALTAKGLRYRLHMKTPGGNADLVMASKRFALFVDGCFWHGCPEHYVRPRSREDFWAAKLQANVVRDRRQVAALDAEGWTIVRIWEHEVSASIDLVLQKVTSALREAVSSVNALRVVRVEVLDPTIGLERRHLELLSDGLPPVRHVDRLRAPKKQRFVT